MDGAEKLLSISQCQTTVIYIQCNSIVRMIGIFSGTDMIKKVPICFFEVPICLIEVPNYPDADLSCYRNVSHRYRSVLVPIVPVPKCLEFAGHPHSTVSRIANKHRLTSEVKDRPRSGRPVLHPEEHNAVGRLVR
jgi:hypothetical protein